MAIFAKAIVPMSFLGFVIPAAALRPVRPLAVAHTRMTSGQMIASQPRISEEEAKRTWLARLDAEPSWGKAASAMASVAAEAAAMSDIEAGTMRVYIGYGTDPTAATSAKQEAKKAWLARLDAQTWGAAAAAMSAMASHFEQVELPKRPSEEDAKHTWLARQEQPSWGGPRKMTEEQAKKAWLARLDAPTWGKVAAAMSTIAAEAEAVQELEEECKAAADQICDQLSPEDEAKRAWLAKQDVTTVGAAAAAALSMASAMSTHATSAQSAEEIAKAEWLAKQEPLRTW